METDAALLKLACFRTQEFRNRSGETVLFSKAAVQVAEALLQDGKDAKKASKRQIAQAAAKLIADDRLCQMKPVAPKQTDPPPVTNKSKEVEASIKNSDASLEGSEALSKETKLTESQPEQESAPPVDVEVMPPSTAIVLPDTLEAFTAQMKVRVQNQHHQFVADAIGIGEAFLAATEKYGEGLKELAAKADLAYNTVTQYVKIAKCFGPSKASWAPAQLPASVDSLVRLSRLEPHELEDAVKQGKVKSGMGRTDVKALLREYRPAKPKAPQKKGNRQKVTQSPPVTLEEVRNRLIPFQEVVEGCQEQFADSQEALIHLLENHASWLKGVLGRLRSKASDSTAESDTRN